MDGSFYEEGGKSGGAVLVCSKHDKLQHIFAFELTHHDTIKSGNDAELWTLAHLLDTIKAEDIGHLIFDSSAVDSRIKGLRSRKGFESNDDPELINRLDDLLGRHAPFPLKQVKRSDGLIPIADIFAEYAAKGGDEAVLADLPPKVKNVPYEFVASPPNGG